MGKAQSAAYIHVNQKIIIMTPFQQAVEQVKAGTLQAPTVSMGTKQIDYFKYQLAVHKFNLSLMAKGMQCRGIKLKDLKQYYGLKGKTASDCLPQFIQLMDQFLGLGV